MLTPQELLPWVLLSTIVGVGILFPYFIFRGFNPEFLDLYKKNFIVIIGLPLAALMSLFIVGFLEQTSGSIEFEGLGFKFIGTSGSVVMWIFCYLALVFSFKLLWDNSYT